MSRLLAAQRAWTVPGWVKDLLWRRAQAIPSLDLRFADNKSLTDAVTGASLVTFTRASTATFIDSSGVLQTAVADVPRFDHNPTTGESLGLLVEEARTNSIRNNTMVGAVAGTPGTLPTNWFAYASTGTGVSTSVIGTGTDNGVNYVDVRFNGTPSASAVWSVITESAGIIPAATGQTWTYSAWIKIASGSTSNVSNPVFFFDETVGSTFVAGASISTSFLTSALNRYPVTYTLTGGATVNRVNAGLRFSVTSGQAIDITLRIGLPQLELGAFATSVIPTTTAAATRSADVASISGSNFSGWYRQDEGTVFASIVSAPNNTITQLATDILDASGNERIFVRRSGAGLLGVAVIDGAVTQADVGAGPVISGGAPYATAFSYRLNSINLATNGQLGTEDTSATIPTPDRMFIGQNFGSTQHANGTIRRLTYWPQRLANSVLQTITL